MQGITKTIIVADRILLREGLTSLLSRTPYKIIRCVSSVTEIRDLKLPPKRPTLTIIGLPREIGKTLQMVHDVRQLVHGGKIVAIGERPDDFADQEIANPGVDGILINVNSREVLLKALDLTFLVQRIVIIGRSEHRDKRYAGGLPAASNSDPSPVMDSSKPASELLAKAISR